MKNKDILRLYQGLQAVKDLPGAKFAYAVGRNLSKVKPVAESIEKALKVPAEYKKYEEEYERRRLAICKELAKPDDKGEPVTEIYEDAQGRKRKKYVFEDQAVFEKKYEEMVKDIKAEYSALFVEIEKNHMEYLQFLDEEAEVLNFHTVKPENLPESITGEQIEAINEIIE